MVDPQFINNLVKELFGTLPPMVQGMRHEVEQHMSNTLKAWFNQMDLVTREEFDVQTQVLHQCQAKLTALEQQLTAWEAQSTPPNPE